MSDNTAAKLVASLWGAAFRQGTLESRESVSDKTLTKSSEDVSRAQIAIIAEIERLRAENAKLREAVAWRPIESAPKTPKDSTRAVELLGWCPDETSPIGGDRRTIWWEPRLRGGCWYSDRDMVEHPTKWTTLPEAPR